MGKYTARIAEKRADDLRLAAIGVFPIMIDYSALFTDSKKAIEDRVEQEILDQCSGYDAMVEMFDAEIAGAKSMTAAEAIIYLRSLATREELD